MTLLPGLEKLAGYRLEKVELYNWGTFDQSIHAFRPNGDWTLLVGENGTGKSTIVDGLLTLLVRPNIRKFNFASGAAKTERDERTYIQGAYDKTVGPSGTPQLKYLRPGNKHYSALLACFRNLQTAEVFTVCQILYLDSNNKPKKFYAYDDRRERGIADDLGNITENTGVLATLKSRDFKATESYAQYFDWLRRKIGCLPKAMDMFNQAAWVKDVSQLDSFVREQMLEKRPWDEKVSQLLSHFAELNETHRVLENVRNQHEKLIPINDNASLYAEAEQRRSQAKAQLDATTLYFHYATQRLLAPMCEEWADKIESLDNQLKEVDSQINSATREVTRIEIEIKGAGGDRMESLRHSIEQEEKSAELKKNARTRFESLLKQAEIDDEVNSAHELMELQSKVRCVSLDTVESRNKAQSAANGLQYQLGKLKSRLVDDQDELISLESRKGNMPRELVFIRDEICRELNIATKDLPFAAELMAVQPEHREWESSIELVLSGFARDLLVKDQHYAKVSGYIDDRRLVDRDGRGQRLSYRRIVNHKDQKASATSKSGQTLFSMLDFRSENELTAWVRGQIAARFDYVACNTIDQFQKSEGAAMTKNRHIKRGKSQHSKDDRSQSVDRRRFLLGWDNREKILSLKDAIQQGEEDLAQLKSREEALTNTIENATRRMGYLEQISNLDNFSDIDDASHRQNASQHRLELEQLKQSNDKIRQLEGQKQALETQIEKDRENFRKWSRESSDLQGQLRQGKQLCGVAAREVDNSKQEGTYETYSTQFGSIETLMEGDPLTIENMATLPVKFQQERRDELERQRATVEAIAIPLRRKMSRFLASYPQFLNEMDSEVESLPQFVALYQQIDEDDLPRHEKRFKQRLNEKVLHEVGVLNSHLENEREEITGKIEEINAGLRRMQWNQGTHIRLEPENSTDAEIRSFRQELIGCLEGYLDGDSQASEETFLRIQKLVDKLRDDNNIRWREKVIDVRRWFNFSAREIVDDTGEGRSYYDGGSGKSGGEKARLAFLVLVAAIVYQYDIDLDDVQSNKFRFVMVDEMFSRTATKFAKYALDLFEKFGLQLLIVAPLDAKARVCEPYVGLHAHVVCSEETHCSEILSYVSQRENGRADSVDGKFTLQQES